jgi:hypothetical protein
MDDHQVLIDLKPGQLCCSLRQIAEWAQLTKNDVERGIDRFSKVKILRQEVIHRKSIITITHKETYDLIINYSETINETKVRQERDKSETQKDNVDKEDKVISIDEAKASSCSESPKKRRSKPADDISFDSENKEYIGITKQDLDLWADAFPGVDFAVEMKKSITWILANKKKGNKTNWRKFLNNWFTKAADRSLTRATYQANSPKMTNREKVMERFKHGGKYCGAECFIDENNIAFQRGHNHQSLKFSEKGFDDQFDNLLRGFGIKA